MTVTSLGRAQLAQPGAAWTNSAGSEMLTRIAGDRDVVGRLLAQVLDQRVEHLAPVHPVAAPLPGQVAQDPLVHQRARG